MKKRVVLLFVFITTTVFSQDFRNTSWGMTKDSVMKAETQKPLNAKHEDTLDCSVNINGYDMALQYLFDENKLYGASYYLTFNSKNYIDAYYKQKKFFTKMLDLLNLKYGKGELVDKENDIFTFYDSSANKIKQYVNDDIESFLDLNETANSIQCKYLEKNIFVLGYVYCIKYSTDSTVILLLVQQNREEIQQEIMYMDKNVYLKMNSNIRNLLTKNSGL